jgi:hypothetical protein
VDFAHKKPQLGALSKALLFQNKTQNGLLAFNLALLLLNKYYLILTSLWNFVIDVYL